MSGREAAEILKKPLFGDEQCIAALRVAGLVQKLKDHRADGDEIDMGALWEFYEPEAIPKPEELNSEHLEREIAFWESARAWEL